LAPQIKKKICYRFLPKGRFPFFATEINIRQDNVWMFILDKHNRMAVQIISEHLANTFRILYELAWEAAEKYTSPEIIAAQKNTALK